MMLDAKQEWDEYLRNMYSHAFQEFHRTDHYSALKETLERMEKDCKDNFYEEEDLAFIEAWIEALGAVNAAECEFMYERGYRDCVALLRRLEVV
jgi:hypothetical protein